MTTATDTGPDVQIDNPDTGEIYPSQVLDHAAALDGIATDTALHTALAHNAALSAELERVKAELAALQAKVGPLDEAWTPPKDNPTLWVEEQLKAQWAAAHRPSYDTHTLIADSHRREREAVDSLLDYTEQMTAHEPADVWDDALRALLDEPVRVDYSYRNTEAWTWAATIVTLAGLREQDATHELPGGRGPTIADYADSMATAPAQGQAFLAQGPAPDDSMAGRHAGDREPLNKLTRRVRTAISAGPATPVAASERTSNKTASKLEVEPGRTGWKRPTWFTRAFDDIFPIKPRDRRKDGGA